jgi:RHS repeat-associated protein
VSPLAKGATQIFAVVVKGTHRSEFVYDGMSRRTGILEKDNGTVTTSKKYVWDGTEIAEERDTTGATATRKFYAQGFVDTDGTNLFYTRDHLGSIRELTDSTQALRARYDYDPYGRVTKVSGDRDSVFLYTGHLWHAQSSLYLAMYRAYDPNLGRWISRDPIEESGGINLYSYVENEVINNVDTLGLDPLDKNSKARCERLRKKIHEIERDVAKRWKEYEEDKFKLPWTSCDPDKQNFKSTRVGHLQKISKLMKAYDEVWKELLLRGCDGPNDPPNPLAVPASEPLPMFSPSSPTEMQRARDRDVAAAATVAAFALALGIGMGVRGRPSSPPPSFQPAPAR